MAKGKKPAFLFGGTAPAGPAAPAKPGFPPKKGAAPFPPKPGAKSPFPFKKKSGK